MDLGLKGRRALVGGGSRGLGRAVADELAREGADVAITARNAEALEQARAEIEAETGRRVAAVATDLAAPGAAAQLAADAKAALGGSIDILVTNQGGPPPGPFESHPPEHWSRAYSLLLESVVEQVRGVLPDMKKAGWGRIITITSIAVKQPNDGLILSNSLRAGVTGLAKSLANELAPYGITVNNVMPGYTRTERLVDLAGDIAQRRGTTVAEAYAEWERQIPMGRLGVPRELAALVAFLASDRATYITGCSIPVDGGWIRSLL
jgi:3-oxoacyl-[acyl-carrier protein] reductase